MQRMGSEGAERGSWRGVGSVWQRWEEVCEWRQSLGGHAGEDMPNQVTKLRVVDHM